jgi:hypothetical protein
VDIEFWKLRKMKRDYAWPGNISDEMRFLLWMFITWPWIWKSGFLKTEDKL